MAIRSEPPLRQSMPPQGATPVPRLEALPLDVLIIVLRHLPLVGRIRTVSRLNKRFNALVYCSIDALTRDDTFRVHSIPAPLLARLPSLTRLDLFALAPEITLPSTLRTLRIWATWSGVRLVYDHLPSLTSLSLLCGYVNALQILVKVHSSLCHLTLSSSVSLPGGAPHTPALADFLRTAHFPALKSLDIQFNEPEQHKAVLSFFLRHASQLESLTFRTPYPEPHQVTGVKLPNLTELCNAPTCMMDVISTQCPRLIAVESDRFVVTKHPLLRKYTYTALLDGTHCNATLSLFPNLTICEVRLDNDTANALVAQNAAHMVKRCWIRGRANRAFLGAATRLTYLSIDCDQLEADVPLALPLLTELELGCDRATLSKQIALIRRFHVSCPCISVVNMFCNSDGGHLFDAVAGLVQEVDQWGSATRLQFQVNGDGTPLMTFLCTLQPHWVTATASDATVFDNFLFS